MKKKIATSLLGMTVLVMTTALPVSAASLPAANYSSSDQNQWTMGFKKNVNYMTRGVQGSNGWYCLYTTETNRGGSFDVNKMKAAKWGSPTSLWKFYGVSKNWTPNLYLGSGYKADDNGNWWLMDGNGRMDPNVAKGAVSGLMRGQRQRKQTTKLRYPIQPEEVIRYMRMESGILLKME